MSGLDRIGHRPIQVICIKFEVVGRVSETQLLMGKQNKLYFVKLQICGD